MALICGASADVMDGLAQADTIALLPAYSDLMSRVPGANKRMPPEFLFGIRVLESHEDEANVKMVMTESSLTSA